MPMDNTPPDSPSMVKSDDIDDVPFNENDMVEVIEYDGGMEASSDEDGNVDDDNNIKETDNAEPAEEEDIIPERDDAKFVFSKHTEGVLCCAFHPKFSDIVATGGIDDKAYVWKTGSDDVLMTSKTHNDSVEMISFSYDGKYLATSDLNGNIHIWNTNDYKKCQEFELEDELSWTHWHHGSNILIGASQKGVIYMFKVSTGEQKMVMAPFGQVCNCGKVFPDGKRLASGYTEGNLKIIDLKQGTVLNTVKFTSDGCAITCLDVHKDNNLIICGCDNGDVVLVSSQSGKIVSVLNSSQTTGLCNYIETVGFCKDPNYHVAASGSLDGNLIIWDIGKQMLRHRTSFPSSVNRLVWHPSKAVLFTCHTDGLVNMYDAKAGNILRDFMGHRRCIFSIAVSRDAKYLMTTSDDKTARIYEINDEQQT